MTTLRFTGHALAAMEKRRIERDWVARVVKTPQWAEPDPLYGARTRWFARVPEFDGRMLRVVTEPDDPLEDAAALAVVTAVWDRNAGRRR